MFEEWRARPVGAGESGERTVEVPGRPAALAGNDAVRYRTTFEDPRGPDDDVAVLELRGLYAHAEIDLTGNRLDGDGVVEHDAYFEPVRVPFVPREDNELVVTCTAPRDRFGGLYDTDLVPSEQAVPGIWWDVSLEGRPLPCVDTIEVSPEVTAAGARLTVTTTVITDGPLDERLTYSLKPAGDHKSRGMMERGAVETDSAGMTTVEHTIEVRDPALWWPRYQGDQHRYTLRAKLGDSERSVTTGICDISHDGTSLVVNGERASIRGLNVLSDDVTDIDRLTDLGANLVRAHAHVLPQEYYEACSEAGILIWQDLPLTGPGSFDTDRGVSLANALVRTRQRHPNLAAVAVHDDPVQSFADGLGSGLLDRFRLRWRAWRTSYDPTPAETIAAAIPDRLPVFPVVGGPGTGADAAAYYPGWDYGTPADVGSLLERYPADLLAEVGAGALAGDGAGDAAGFDADKHDRHVRDGVEASQAYQADLLRTVVEQMRCVGTGVIPFALRDTDDAGMGVYAREGTPKTATDTLSTAFQPVQAFLADPAATESEVVVVNDTPTSRTATVEWVAGTETGELDVTVGENDRWRGGPISIPSGAGSVTLRLRLPGGDVKNAYDRS